MAVQPLTNPIPPPATSLPPTGGSATVAAATGDAGPSERPAPSPSHEALSRAAEQLREALDPLIQTYAQYRVNPKTHLVRVQIVDQASGKVIRQIPSEALARFAESWHQFVGALLDHHT